MASIEDLIANPQVASISGSFAAGTQAKLGQEGLKLENLQRRLNYREALAEVETNALVRQMKKKKLQFDLAHQDELLTSGLEVDRMNLRDPILDDVARDIPFVQSEEDYATFLKKHQNVLPQMKGLLTPEGTPKAWKDALPALNDLRNERLYSIEHQQALQLAEVRASAMNPSFTAPKLDPYQIDAARTANDKFLEDNAFDLGGDTESSDRRRLEYTIAYITQQINQARADRGLKTNQDEVRSKVLGLAKNRIKGQEFRIGKLAVGIPFIQDSTIDWDGLNEDINREFEMSVPDQSTGVSVSGPAGLLQGGEFKTVDEAIAAGHKSGDKVTINGVTGTLQ